ncbi:HvfC/BufC N-terminal domain-containing protein [Eoetvoesiella caeni]
MNGQQAFFDALRDPAQPIPAGLTVWNGSDPAVRFAVYRNNVIVSLIDALADTYPVAQELVGEEFFRAMARLYLDVEPPRSRILAFYGASFPDFIERFPPAASVPYLADVARLEMLRVRAYHAADRAALSTEAIAPFLTDVDQLPDLLVAFHPSVGVLRSRYAAISLWAAHQGIADITMVDPDAPESALVIRPHLDVEVIRVTASACDFVAHLLDGATMGSALEQASLAHTDFDLGNTLGLLIQKQLISSITTPRRTQP